jgi:hypothetical protein
MSHNDVIVGGSIVSLSVSTALGVAGTVGPAIGDEPETAARLSGDRAEWWGHRGGHTPAASRRAGRRQSGRGSDGRPKRAGRAPQ